MKKLLALPLLLLASACTTAIPVTVKFPDAPDVLRQPCPQLDTLKKDDPKLSDMMTTVTNNYVKYHDCSSKVDAWNEWYKTQQDLYNKTGK